MSYAKQIDDLEKWLSENSSKYTKIKENFSDVKRLQSMVKEQVPVILLPILEYDPREHTSDVAVAAVTEVRVRSTAMLDNVHFIEVYEEKKEMLDQFLLYAADEERTKDETADPDSLEPGVG